MKLSKRVVLSLLTILMSIGIFAVSVDQARADSRFSTSCQLDKFLNGNENQTDARLGLSCQNLDRQFMNLGNYIANNDGTLAWQRNGNFQETCDHSFIEQNHILKSACKKIDGSRIDSQLDLNENFLVEDHGYVVYTGPSDLNGSTKRIVVLNQPSSRCIPPDPCVVNRQPWHPEPPGRSLLPPT
ncbi:MAG: CVNH domain-containing protein [Rhizonema sp. NSF051]|nr:CVNH domain-containing protein [Rhizonema sp. NSF051]